MVFKKIFVRNKKVKFPKLEKTNVQVKPRKISQRAANYLLLSFVFGMVGLSALTIVSNAFRSTHSEKPVVQVSDRDSRNLSNRVGLFMTDFLNSYFSDNSPENESRLKDFYGNGLDIKNAQVTNLESKLTGAVLIEITDHLATYRVGYAVKVDDEWKNNVGVINIPYSVKDNKFYVYDDENEDKILTVFVGQNENLDFFKFINEILGEDYKNIEAKYGGRD